ncbi:hypothetical protein BN2537_9543 [Streptomyces venezuelae]|nr:hypothetical protein BN2537_9543 [Streptomyces venezuelae]
MFILQDYPIPLLRTRRAGNPSKISETFPHSCRVNEVYGDHTT